MAKFWRAWRADEIVAVYNKDNNEDVSVKLRCGGSGTAYKITSHEAVKEIESVLAAEEAERFRLEGELHSLEWKIKDASRKLELLQNAKAELTPSLARDILNELMPVLDGSRAYVKASEKERLMELLKEPA